MMRTLIAICICVLTGCTSSQLYEGWDQPAPQQDLIQPTDPVAEARAQKLDNSRSYNPHANDADNYGYYGWGGWGGWHGGGWGYGHHW